MPVATVTLLFPMTVAVLVHMIDSVPTVVVTIIVAAFIVQL